jgi:branched-chain amino acid transport system substrate-binding protein
MAAEARRLLCAVALIACATVAAPGCRQEPAPVRVAVLVECSGPLDFFRQPMLAGAQLPLVERGAVRKGRSPDDGLTGAEAGERPVELIEGCTEVGDLTLLITETRRLIETEGADVIISPAGETEGLVMRRIAARYPDTTFLLASAARDATLRRPSPNLFRFVADGAQQAAGLAAHARHDLGWRRAAVVFDDLPFSWETAAGFVAEFCALGGRVAAREVFTGSAATDRALAARLAREVDGVALVSTFFNPAHFLRAYSRHVGRLSRRLVLNGFGFTLPGALPPRRVDLSGVVFSLDIPLASDRPQWRRYLRAYERAFPGLESGVVDSRPVFTVYNSPLVYAVYLSTEAVARALERSGGELGARQHRLRAALRALAFDGPAGPVRLDRNRQAIVSVYLRRLAGRGRAVHARPVRVVRDVEQTFAGAFDARTPAPSRELPRCLDGPVPPWARGWVRAARSSR